MNARHVSRGLFRVANTHCTRSQKSQELCQVIVVDPRLSIPRERERDGNGGFKFRIVKADPGLAQRSSLSLSISSFILITPLPFLPFSSPSSAFILLPSIRSLYGLFFAPCPTNCFRIGESWERSMVTVDWIARFR